MTDIIELAALHGEFIPEDNLGPDAYLFDFDRLKAFSDAIRQDQIEKDAKICDALSGLDEKGLPFDDESINVAYAEDCAEAIRNQLRKEDE